MLIDRPILFLPVEIPVRELDYKLNISRHFIDDNFDVIIGLPAYIRDQLSLTNIQGVFLEKGINPIPEYYESLAKKGLYVYDLTDEGMGALVYSITNETAVNTLGKMRKIFLWGSYQKNDLLAKNSSADLISKFEVTGNPGFDLCFPRFIPYHQQLLSQKLPETYILVNTNFASCNGMSCEEQIKSCQQISQETIDHIYEMQQIEKKQFVVFKEWLLNIIQSFPDEQFLIRPHPAEFMEAYDFLRQYPNVFISKEGTSNQVIASAKLVLHKDCTTALQSFLMEKPVISIGGEEVRTGKEQWALAFGTVPLTVQHAIGQISFILRTQHHKSKDIVDISKRSKNILNSCFANIGQSTQVLKESILNDIGGAFDGMTPYELKDSRSWLARLKLSIRRYLPLHYKIAKAARETLIEYTKHDIEKRLSLFEEVDPLGINYKVKKIYPNTYWIRKK